MPPYCFSHSSDWRSDEECGATYCRLSSTLLSTDDRAGFSYLTADWLRRGALAGHLGSEIAITSITTQGDGAH